MRSFHYRARTNIRRLLWLWDKCDETDCFEIKLSCVPVGPDGKCGPCPYNSPAGWVDGKACLEERRLQPYQYRDGFHSTATFEKPYMHFEQYNRYRFKWASANVCHVGGAYAAGDLRYFNCGCGIRCARCMFGPYLRTAWGRFILGRVRGSEASANHNRKRQPMNAVYTTAPEWWYSN